ncbi:hypothetical protein PAXRUDRAFT_20521 [Paxillus rubicundulus Ve08.2h10]|uniref:Reverse transcriptase Ty1/copia-type domain-containing protein n=1 Tax=Paxillus rubicundulus Ve08.2h10 TaxID=930991 RepID=A0A0D0CSA0_9AGAM|nr:hypothetical protein PAXRUDRAFT_20521 [Paxillus rubicundulus Ve08.2h10]
MDVSTTYLNRELEEDLYLLPPDGVPIQPSYCWKLQYKPIRAQKSSQEIPTQPSRPLLVQSIRLVSQICLLTQLPMPSPGQ